MISAPMLALKTPCHMLLPVWSIPRAPRLVQATADEDQLLTWAVGKNTVKPPKKGQKNGWNCNMNTFLIRCLMILVIL